MLIPGKRRRRTNSKETGRIRTNFYDLIQAINEEVEPDQDALVTSTVMNIVESGKAKWIKYHRHPERIFLWH
jgi:hypothetical protein